MTYCFLSATHRSLQLQGIAQLRLRVQLFARLQDAQLVDLKCIPVVAVQNLELDMIRITHELGGCVNLKKF